MPIESTLAESPQILHVEFHPIILNAWGAVTKIRSDDKYSSLMELMVLQVPVELYADCTRISDEIIDRFWQALEEYPRDLSPRIVWGGCRKGQDRRSDPVGNAKDPRHHVLLWKWASPEERDRFKDPTVNDIDPGNPVYYDDWYHQAVSLPLAALVSGGATITTHDLQVSVALDSEGWPMRARKSR